MADLIAHVAAGLLPGGKGGDINDWPAGFGYQVFFGRYRRCVLLNYGSHQDEFSIEIGQTAICSGKQTLVGADVDNAGEFL
jgi:hypothetical protein